MDENYRTIRLGSLHAFPITQFGDNSNQRVLEAKHSGRIVLSNSIFRRIHFLNQSPMIFKLTKDDLSIVCGVHSFDGEEGKVLVPLWILKALGLESDGIVSLEMLTKSMPKGSFAKFQPLTKAFLDIRDPKTTLEHCLHSYVCISKDNIISIYYENQIYELRICETLPANTIDITECDLVVDFVEMEKKPVLPDELPDECDLDKLQTQAQTQAVNSFSPFSGAGKTMRGKEVKTLKPSCDTQTQKRKAGAPDYDYQMGKLLFKRRKKDVSLPEPMDTNQETKKETQTKQKNKPKEDNRQTSSGRKEALSGRLDPTLIPCDLQTDAGIASRVNSGDCQLFLIVLIVVTTTALHTHAIQLEESPHFRAIGVHQYSQ
ncbi:unnamed protein product [Medioppia subpectinata]|uniref:Ubiquitin fusion degradaton protein n=1 Tax=Medioppia subpectinata TaxID=1979941 RepID=A0A7R9KV00_9ACAR|nr:unnamed protein product [Medioppia subpectinata]CAG2109965.1 unnamed protein product [Medioppia subpectinata]